MGCEARCRLITKQRKRLFVVVRSFFLLFVVFFVFFLLFFCLFVLISFYKL